jgi:SulP family sulfate permease
MESLLTAKSVDETTETHSRKRRAAQVQAQAASRVLSRIFGGIISCAETGQTVINSKGSEEAPTPRSSAPGSCCS